MARTTPEQLVRELGTCKAIGRKPVHVPPHERPSRSVSAEEYAKNPENFVVICGNTIALRCRAQSKQQKRRCRLAASKGMQVCKFHGGAPGTGETTAASRKRTAERMTVHGRETRVKRRKRSQKAAEFRILERVLREYDYFRKEQ